MEIFYTKILKVDPATGQIAIAAFADAQNLTLYLEGILNEIANNEGDREYEFDQDKLTTRTVSHLSCISFARCGRGQTREA